MLPRERYDNRVKVLILVLLMKEHPVDGPIGIDREVAREYCRVVNPFTTPSIICWYGEILVLLGYGLVDQRSTTANGQYMVLILVLLGYGLVELIKQVNFLLAAMS